MDFFYRGGLWGQHGSVEIDHAFRELLASKGFGAMHGSGISEAQWEELKKCRYLRMPHEQEQQAEEQEEGGSGLMNFKFQDVYESHTH